MPKPLKVFFIEGLGKCLCILPKTEIKDKVTIKTKETIDDRFQLVEARFRTYRHTIILTRTRKRKASRPIFTLNNDDDAENKSALVNEIEMLISIEKVLKEVRDSMRETRKKIEIREHKMKLAAEWKQIALVLDRTFFYLFLLVAIITLVIIFIRTILHKNGY